MYQMSLTLNEKFFSYIMARTSYIWDDNDILIVLDQHAEFTFIVLAHWNNRQRVDMSLHSDTLSRFQSNQPLLFLHNAVRLAEKQQIPILVFGLTWPKLEPTIYRTRGKHANNYTTDVVSLTS
jgi:hypothetical protein